MIPDAVYSYSYSYPSIYLTSDINSTQLRQNFNSLLPIPPPPLTRLRPNTLGDIPLPPLLTPRLQSRPHIPPTLAGQKPRPRPEIILLVREQQVEDLALVVVRGLHFVFDAVQRVRVFHVVGGGLHVAGCHC